MAGRIAYYGNIIKDGLVLNLDAAKVDSYPGSGTVWRDIAGGVITGSLINGPTFDSTNGGSIVFDGSNDYVDCGSNNIYTLGNNFSLECWVYPTVLGSGNGDELFSLATGGGIPYISYGLEWMNTNRFRMSIGNTSNTFLNYNSTDTYSLNNWYHILGTYNGSVITLYINNILQNTTNVSTTVLYSLNRLTIGTWYFDISPTNAFTGRISSVRLYNRALSAQEVTQNYNAMKGRYGL